MNYDQMSSRLAGPIGVMKQFISKAGRDTAEDATQVFGGRALTVTGMGKLVENVSVVAITRKTTDRYFSIIELLALMLSLPELKMFWVT